ncbi:hypothetical protein Metho_2641 (plasmid) [Methanomethylovorans hollandica DSM 15978]|jgi:hypothetical protein|uniref:Uncharacterized protein n=1 Tax=Methanomethylovorans hollandica (strain DSM 15978 / NBRC 107637 / DMS1) TaxID=867904 RepID=L0L094_METHD|nr:hypothetical protein [Methanomethylovorans hollandica]AGB50771.1 hypothetical protein Metho_2641 [Methanomethylovorans hollandica DSM 15978]
MLDFDIEQIRERLILASETGDSKSFVKEMDNLLDAGYTKIEYFKRMVAHNGDRLEISVFHPQKRLTIRSINGIFNHALFGKYYGIFRAKPPIDTIFKHYNEMSPEEYEWVSDV